ncbi:MAG: type II secretion system F family protein [Acidimicrobiia bacterium]|nr:type II secretion system F family protein [Acidimicrobiia bacterium]NNC74007.1 hypothetical protein [Acidimicrobiia bacterium]
MMVLVAVVAAVLILVGPLPLRRRLRADAGDEVAFTELVAMALTAGHGFDAAVLVAASAVGGSIAERARRAVRGRDSGEEAPVVFAVAVRARASGAPLGDSVAQLAEGLRAERMESARLAARRLPVRLVLPLTLLILPGTVLLTVTPVLLGAIERFAL